MNFPPPAWVTEAAEEALRTVAPNHYSHPKGRIRLREAIKKFYGPQLGRELDVESEILVTSGANEGKCKSGHHGSPPDGGGFAQDNILSLPRSWNKGTRSSCSNHSSTSICRP